MPRWVNRKFSPHPSHRHTGPLPIPGGRYRSSGRKLGYSLRNNHGIVIADLAPMVDYRGLPLQEAMMNKFALPAAACACTLVLGGCTTDDPYQRTKTGAVIGAIAGGVLGHQIDGGSGKWVGAAVGALAGGSVGYYMDNQQREFEQALADEQANNALEIERLRDETLKLTVDNEVSFDFDRADIRPSFRASLDKLAQLIIKYDRTVVHIVGHTDSTGSAEYNQNLSERRAQSVADYLVARGVNASRLVSSGRGESQPRATNDTEAGRQLNRRVEIFVKPIVQGREAEAYQAPI